MKIYKTDLIKRAQERTGDLTRLQDAGLVCLDGSFFPSVHYPPITMYPPADEESLFEGYVNPDDGLFDIYVHIPFCIRQCAFCHYPVMTAYSDGEKDYYLSMLEKEMDIYMRRLGLRAVKARSILVGGGTPTHVTPSQLTRFLKFFTARLDVSSCTQFNYDVDPLTLLGNEGMERLNIMKSYGVHRLTIGVQSLDDGILQKMNRHHTAEDAIKAIERSRNVGFKINIEFIYGYRGQTLENWIDVMEKAAALGTEEIQLYRLKLSAYGDRQGPVLKSFNKNPEEFPSVEDVILMKQIAFLILSYNGYNENLRRVFSKDPNVFSHYADNQCCKLFDQIGFGLTAFSSLRDRFVLNTQDFKEYYAAIERGKLPANRGLIRNEDDRLRWAIILPLKNRKVYKKFYRLQTGASLNEVFRGKIEKLKNYGLLYEDDVVLELTQLGAFFADEVCQQFHHPDYAPFPKTAYARGELSPYDDCQPRCAEADKPHDRSIVTRASMGSNLQR